MTVAQVAKQFVERRGFHTSAREGFPKTITEERTCRGGNCCKRFSDADESAKLLRDYIRLSLRHAEEKRRSTGPAVAVVQDPIIALLFEERPVGPLKPPVNFYCLTVNPQRLREEMYEATFFLMEPVAKMANITGNSAGFQPILLKFAIGKTVAGIRWPDLAAESELTCRLLDESKNWAISLLKHTVGAEPSERLVTDATELSYAELLEKEAQAKAETAATAQKQKERQETT